MKKSMMFTGIAMMLIQFLIVGIYAISQMTLTESQLNIMVAIAVLVPFNLVSVGLFIGGLFSE